MSTILVDLKIHDVTPHDSNIRHDLGDLEELTASIKAQGILSPITVAPFPGIVGRYTIIAGHRRHAAAAAAGLVEVPCVIRNDLTEPADQVAAMLVENLQRRDLSVMEEAAAYQQLELLGVSVAKIAKSTGRGKATVEKRLKLTRLPENCQGWVDQGQLSLRDAEGLLGFLDDEEIMQEVAESASASSAVYAPKQVGWRRDREERARQQAALDAAEDEVPDAEYEARRAASQQRAEAAVQERQAKIAAFEASSIRVQDWVDSWLARDPQQFAEMLCRILLMEHVAEEDTAFLPILGLPPMGEDEDEADWIAGTQKLIAAAPAAQVLAAAALMSIGLLDPSPWKWWETLAALVEVAGYEPDKTEAEYLRAVQ